MTNLESVITNYYADTCLSCSVRDSIDLYGNILKMSKMSSHQIKIFVKIYINVIKINLSVMCC